MNEPDTTPRTTPDRETPLKLPTAKRLLALPPVVRGGLALIVASLLLGFVTLATNSPSQGTQEQSESLADVATASYFGDIDIEAKAAYVVDLRTGEVLYRHNAETQLPLASITKLMSALVVAETLERNREITITEESLSPEGDSGFEPGQTWTVGDLLDFTLVTSSNDGAHALASAVTSITPFADLMNQKAAAIGMSQTYFINETGLDASETLAGSYGSAQDIAALLEYMVASKPSLLEATRYGALSFETLNGDSFPATNTNDALGDLPGLVASKTGFTDLAGGNLAIVFDVGLRHPVAAVVLGSSFDGRFSDMRRLVDRTFLALSGGTPTETFDAGYGPSTMD